MEERTCCFIGHRRIREKERVFSTVKKVVERLIVEKGVKIFHFGSKSEFDEICHAVVTELRKTRRELVRIQYRGFRKAGREGVSEFNLRSLWNKSGYQQKIVKKDKKKGKYFSITLYKDCPEYEGLTFMEVNFCKIKRIRRKRMLFPREIVLYTDAPPNEEYEREVNRIVRCSVCGEEYRRKELLSSDEKMICEGCFHFELDKWFMEEMAKVIQKIRDGR